jgi:predicted enzyme related to lactoylglutathione lyase
MAYPVAMFEVVSDDHERAQTFYSALFEWKVQVDPAMGGYGLVDTGAGDTAIVGGIGPSTGPGDTGVRFYVRVDDLAEFLARAVELGGTRLVEPTELPGGYGSFAVFADPDGNTVGLWA